MTNVSDLCSGHMDVFSLLVHRHVDLMKENKSFKPLGGGYDSGRCTHKADLIWARYKTSSGKLENSKTVWCSEHHRGHQKGPKVDKAHTEHK